MAAFVYPRSAHDRRHGPRGYADTASYRPWLRDEFTFRCVYCLLREQWGRLRGTFDLDHFQPVTQQPDAALDYDNLLYSCAACNAAKGAQTIPDPCQALLDGNVWVEDDGRLVAQTPAARQLVRVLGLDDNEYREFRLLWIGILTLAQRHDLALYQRLLGFPDDLPNLARLRPPGGNTRPDGVRASYHTQRKAGTLPPGY